jgi:HTH-type transcriptional regulator/antitoxin HigA
MNITIIKSEKQYQKYLSRMGEIFMATNDSVNSDELDLLALVIEKYEDENFPIPTPDPIDAIQFIMEQNNMTDRDLARILNSRSRASEILNRKRKLSLLHIRKLVKELHIPAELLISDYSLNKSKSLTSS